MIAKTFEKFNYTSVGISTLLLFGASYYYTTLEINWSFVDSKTLNGNINIWSIASFYLCN